MDTSARNRTLRWPAAVWSAVLVWCAAGVAVGAGPRERVQVTAWPNKVLYDVGETAQVEVTVVNMSGQALRARLVVRVVWEMADGKVLLDRPMEVAAGKTVKATASWANVPEVLGCEVRAELVGQDGKAVGQDSEYFNVCRHLDACRVGIHGCPGLTTNSTGAFLRQIPRRMARIRSGYVNICEYYAAKSYSLNMAPEEDEWAGLFWQSKEALRRMIREGHRHGQKAVLYATSYGGHSIDDLDLPLRHPEWVTYNRLGQPDGAGIDVKNEDALRLVPKRNTHYPACMPSTRFNWMNQGLLDHHIDQLIANKKMFGMDGVRYDGEPGSQWGQFDVTGKPMPGPAERVRQHIRMIRHIRTRVRKAWPDYLFMWNAGKAVGEAAVDLRHGVLAPALAALVADGGAMCNEEVRLAYAPHNAFHQWNAFADCMVSDVDLTRPAGGYAYVLFPWTSTVHRNTDEIGYSILLAAGHHPWYGMPVNDYKTDPGGTHYPVQKELFAFATRFSAMLWGHGIQRVREPEKVVTVASDKGQIWWRRFVHRRVLADGRAVLTVHLLNAPPTPGMGVLKQPLPDPIDRVRVRFAVPVKTVWLATARPGPARQVKQGRKVHETCGPMQYGPVACTQGELVVPRLRVWTMVVAELDTTNQPQQKGAK